MNKKVIRVVGAMLVAMGASGAHAQTQGLVTFNGKLNTSTCKVRAGDTNQTITLPEIQASTLATKGDTAGSTMFTIGVEGCPETGGPNLVKAHWETTNIDLDTGNALNIAAATPAANVTVQLLDGDGKTPVPLGSAGVGVPITGTGAARGATLHYGGQYYAKGLATAGNVTATARFTLAYN